MDTDRLGISRDPQLVEHRERVIHSAEKEVINNPGQSQRKDSVKLTASAWTKCRLTATCGTYIDTIVYVVKGEAQSCLD